MPVMWILDAAGSVLPEGLGFFSIGWWVIHLLAIALVFTFGYRKGQLDERRGARRPARQSENPPT